MSGYRRVNYYELCRLCTSSEGTKMHIFREEGRRRQLPTKIQICLPLQVCEDDSLPKIICNHCVDKLESFYDFRESCVNAEAMLESYFTSLRYTDDFQRDGKCYVKDESPPKQNRNNNENCLRPQNDIKANCPEAVVAQSQVVATKTQLEQPNVKPEQQQANPLVHTAEIHIANSTVGQLQQQQAQFKCPTTMETTTNAVEQRTEAQVSTFTYEACVNSVCGGDASGEGTSAVNKVEDGSTQCSDGDFKNESEYDEAKRNGAETAATTTVDIQPVAFAGQEMLLEFSLIKDRDTYLRTDDQSTIARSSIAQIGEFLRMKTVYAPAIVEPSASEEEPGNRCDKCGKAFASQEELALHHPNCNVGDKNFACDVCGKIFKRKEHLLQHRKLHTGERPYVCTSCGKAFSRKEHLVRHSVSHTGEKMHGCEMCGKAFSRKDNLLKHRKTHGITGPYMCDICGKSFVVKHYYLMHRSSHSGEQPYKCETCGKSFAVKQYLVSHKLRHTRNKPYICTPAVSANEILETYRRLHTT